MSRRIFTTLSLISAMLAACTVVLWPWSFWADPCTDCLSFSGDFHVAVQDGRVSFFNSKDYGPYHGSVVSFADNAFAAERGFGNTLGVYYRYFRWDNWGGVLWTLSVSLAYPLVVFAVLPATWAWLRWRAKRTNGGSGVTIVE